MTHVFFVQFVNIKLGLTHDLYHMVCFSIHYFYKQYL